MADTLSALPSSVTMPHTASRALVAEWHIVTCHVFEVLWVWSVAKAEYRHCQSIWPRLAIASCWRRCCQQRGHTGSAVVPLCQPSITTFASSTVCLASHAVKACRHDLTPSSQCQCFAAVQHEPCGAWCRSRLVLRTSCWHPSSTACGVLQLRQNYITPHCIKCMASRSQAPFVSLHRFAPFGFTQQALCKIAYAGPGLSAACTPRSLRALRAVACRPCGVRALWHQSGAARRVLVSGFAVYLVCAPAHPWGLLASQASPARSARPPPKGISLHTSQTILMNQQLTISCG